jgi:hypothetical protein
MNKTEKQHSRTWQSVCDEFFSTQQASYQESPCPLPSMRLPLCLRALFYRPAADAAAFDDAEMDITEDVLFHFAENGRGDVRLKARVHRIPVSKKGCFRVVSAFLSPEGERLANGSDVTLLREYVERKYELFRREEGLPTLHYFFIIGSERPFDEGCQPLARPTVVLCHPLESGLWDFRLPRGDIDMPTADFLLHILPGMRDAYADAMAAEIDRWDQTNFITQDALRERLRLDPSTYHGFLSRWLDTLFARGGYGRDSRGYIYGPSMTLPPGKWARRCRRYDTTPRKIFWQNVICILCIVLIILYSGLWLFGNISGLSSQLAWILPAVAGLCSQWVVWHMRKRSVR